MTELELYLTRDYNPSSSASSSAGALSHVITSDVLALRTLRQTGVVDAINLHAAVHYRHRDGMYELARLCSVF